MKDETLEEMKQIVRHEKIRLLETFRTHEDLEMTIDDEEQVLIIDLFDSMNLLIDEIYRLKGALRFCFLRLPQKLNPDLTAGIAECAVKVRETLKDDW